MNQPQLIFGGTFDPVHFGHLLVARDVAEQLGAARVVLVPAAQPPHKPPPPSRGRPRLEMLRLATDGDPLFEVSSLELDRSGPSYTYDTLRQLRDIHGAEAQLTWMIGMDMLLELHSWYRASDVVELARVVTARRPADGGNDAGQPRIAELTGHFGHQRAAQLIADVLDTRLIDISSTEIRRRVAARRPIGYLTPEPVVDYIVTNRLYRD